MTNMMEEIEWDHVIVGVLVAGIIFAFLWLISSWFARATKYSDYINAQKIQLCLDQKVDYKTCYNGLYYDSHFK